MVPVKTADVIEYLGYEYYKCTGRYYYFAYNPCNISYIHSFVMEGKSVCENWWV